MKPVRLEKRVPEKNQHRFYRLLLAPTLFGEWSLIREWGRIGHPGTVRIESYATEADAAAEFNRKAREKERRGYVIRPHQAVRWERPCRHRTAGVSCKLTV